ncbi:hypothetical protein MRY87_08740, partial [bacterium]|nr:hypothetical protein [bacterium]
MKMQSEGGAIFLELALSVGILVTVLFGMVEFFVNSRVQQDLIVVSEEIALESLRSCSHETDSN